ncbi:hypothetical protein LguiB_018813 [Lonicera macranthoides]
MIVDSTPPLLQVTSSYFLSSFPSFFSRRQSGKFLIRVTSSSVLSFGSFGLNT